MCVRVSDDGERGYVSAAAAAAAEWRQEPRRHVTGAPLLAVSPRIRAASRRVAPLRAPATQRPPLETSRDDDDDGRRGEQRRPTGGSSRPHGADASALATYCATLVIAASRRSAIRRVVSGVALLCDSVRDSSSASSTVASSFPHEIAQHSDLETDRD